MPFTIPASTSRTITMNGDSITATVGWYYPLKASVDAWFTSRSYVNGVPIETDHGRAYWENKGRSGDKVADLATNISAFCTSFNPIRVIIHTGINDVTNTLDAAFQTSVDSVLDQIVAAGIAATSILWITPIGFGENWPSGANANDTEMDTKSGIITSRCTVKGAWSLNLRSAFFAYQAANNPSHATSGILTVDGAHFNRTGGTDWFSSQVLANITLGTPNP